MIGDILNTVGAFALPGFGKLADGTPVLNSSFGILSGSKDDWVIGIGRNTNVIGPESKLVVDWESAIFGTLKSKIISNPTTQLILAPLGGSSGDTALVIGDKVALNYWGKTVSVNRLRAGDWHAKWESGGKEPKLTAAGAILGVGIILLLGLVITVRIVFTANKPKDPKQGNWATLAEKICQIAIPWTERTWFASVEAFEKATSAAFKNEKKAYADAQSIKNQRADLLEENESVNNALNIKANQKANYDLGHDDSISEDGEGNVINFQEDSTRVISGTKDLL